MNHIYHQLNERPYAPIPVYKALQDTVADIKRVTVDMREADAGRVGYPCSAHKMLAIGVDAESPK